MSKGRVPQFPYLKKPMKYDPRLLWADILLQLPFFSYKNLAKCCAMMFSNRVRVTCRPNQPTSGRLPPRAARGHVQTNIAGTARPQIRLSTWSTPNFGMSTPTRIHIKTSLCFMSITSLITWNLQWISQSFNGFPLGPRMFTLRAILRAAARTSFHLANLVQGATVLTIPGCAQRHVGVPTEV